MSFHYEKDASKIVTVTMDMDGPVNSMSDAFLPLFESTLEFIDHGADQTASGRTQRVAHGDCTTHHIGNLVADIKIFHITECN